MLPAVYSLARSQQRIVLGAELARGGEGAVYTLAGRNDLVVKIYHPAKHPRPGKLERMVDNPPDDPTAAQGHCSIAWPRELLHDDRGRTIGYAMPRITDGVALHNLYNLKSRLVKVPGFHWRYLHVAARNLASAVAAIHAKGYCIGDLNESNILVQRTALLTVVDTDSFQVPNPGGPTYLCPVGKPDYTPPEIQGQDFHQLRRTREHDHFALAVLLFLILQEGSHPFRGLGPPPDLGERIQRGLFPFVPGAGAKPPPHALFAELAPPLRELFRTAFHAGHRDPAARPGARDWVKALDQAQAGLVVCKVNPQHQYHGGVGRCTWCARCQVLGGLDVYPSPSAQRQARPAPPPARPRPAPPRPAPTPSPPPSPPAQPRPAPTPRPVQPPVPPVRAPWPRAWTLGIAAALVLLVVGGVLYNLWINSAPALIEQARAALNQGDEAAAEQALERAKQQDPAPVLAFVEDRAALYRALAERAGASGETQKAALAQTEAQRWQDKAARLAAAALIADTLVEIRGGTFQMGCSPGDWQCADDEEPVHAVKVAPFRIGKYEVTQAQWEGVMGGNPSRFQGDDRPVENVSWDNVQTFLSRLNSAGYGKPFRLPSEAEWEYAARAGAETRYWWGEEIGQGNANCDGCGSDWDGEETAPVGSFKPNAFGLYDTAGNVWEWVQDCWHEDYAGAPADGSEWRNSCQSDGRVLRGGSWGSYTRALRVSYRVRSNPVNRLSYYGLRLAQDL